MKLTTTFPSKQRCCHPVFHLAGTRSTQCRAEQAWTLRVAARTAWVGADPVALDVAWCPQGVVSLPAWFAPGGSPLLCWVLHACPSCPQSSRSLPMSCSPSPASMDRCEAPLGICQVLSFLPWTCATACFSGLPSCQKRRSSPCSSRTASPSPGSRCPGTGRAGGRTSALRGN